MKKRNRRLFATAVLLMWICGLSALCRTETVRGEPAGSGSLRTEDRTGALQTEEPESVSAEDLWSTLPFIVEREETEAAQDNTVSWFFPEAADIPLPQRWYAGDYGRKPVVQYQGRYGTCWALAAVSALEAALLPERHLVFSADHMARQNAFTVDLNEGGDYLMSMAYLSGWQGPVTVEEDPYGDGYSPSGLSPAVHVQEIQVLQDAPDRQIKEAVRQYGAVQTSLYMSRETIAPGDGEASSFYNKDARAYYYPESRTPNHEVIILGWDDNFPGDLFPESPGQNGAFICQNTWEEGFEGDGVFYVSYADPNLAETGILYTRVEPTDNYAKIYQNDDCGWQGRQGYEQETCWFANVYTAGASESLAAVGFYATGVDTSFDLYLTEEFSGVESFARKQFLQSGTLQNAGFYTVDLETPQPLEEGERFAVMVCVRTPGTGTPVAVEYRADQYTQNVVTEGREGYLSPDGIRWENTEELFGTNVCLKAYTRENDGDF